MKSKSRISFTYYRESRVFSPFVKRDVYVVYSVKQRKMRSSEHNVYTLEKKYNFEAKAYYIVIHDGTGRFVWRKPP